MLMYSIAPNACLEHSNFLTVTEQPACGRRPVEANVPPAADFKAPPGPNRNALLGAGHPRTAHTSPTTSFLTATTLIYAIGAVLPQLLAPDLPSNGYSMVRLTLPHSNYQAQKGPVLLFFVTTSPNRDWVICAPAAFLRCSSQFSSSFSGIEP